MDNEDKHDTSVESLLHISGTTDGHTHFAKSGSSHVWASTAPRVNACDFTITQKGDMYNREERSCNVIISTMLNLVKCEDNTGEFDDTNSLTQPRNTTRQARGTGDDVSGVTKMKQEKMNMIETEKRQDTGSCVGLEY